MNLYEMSAAQAADAIRSGEMSSEELVQACLNRIDALEESVGAWEHLNPDYVLQQARDADLHRRGGMSTGPLHGVPVGIKDIFDTKDMPTEDGTPLHAGRTPAYDATTVALLREAGAIIMGKTVTTELAVYAPGKTRNPHDTSRTPGGSSSGSAAAVAAQMVPLSIGTQTNGSVIRPASYCGVYGYKPSHGLISRYRVLQQSRVLDQVGVFGRSVGDVALIAEQLMAYDERDGDMRPRARPNLVSKADEEPLVPPRLALVKTSAWEQADEDVQGAFGELAAFLGSKVEEIDL
ncbi:MAG: amidase, partial [Sedimenticola sp.]